MNPKISAYTQIHGAFDFNKTPLAPAGCKLIVHDRIDEQGTWSEHGTRGFYIRSALEHYRNYICYVPTTCATRASNTIKFFPKVCTMPMTSATDRIYMILADLLTILKDPQPAVPFLHQGIELNEVIRTIQALFFLDQDKRTYSSKGSKPPSPPRSPQSNELPNPRQLNFVQSVPSYTKSSTASFTKAN